MSSENPPVYLFTGELVQIENRVLCDPFTTVIIECTQSSDPVFSAGFFAIKDEEQRENFSSM